MHSPQVPFSHSPEVFLSFSFCRTTLRSRLRVPLTEPSGNNHVSRMEIGKMNIFIPERGFPVTDTDQINQDQPSSDLYDGRSNIGKLDRGIGNFSPATRLGEACKLELIYLQGI